MYLMFGSEIMFTGKVDTKFHAAGETK